MKGHYQRGKKKKIRERGEIWVKRSNGFLKGLFDIVKTPCASLVLECVCSRELRHCSSDWQV